MWIEKRKNSYRMYDRYTDLKGEVHKVSVAMKKKTPQEINRAQIKLAALIEERTAKLGVDLTFRELTEYYLYQKKPEIKESTHRRNTRECNTLNKLIGDYRVNGLTSSIVRTKVAGYSKTPTAFNEHIKRFKEIIRWGYRNDLVENPSFIDKIDMMKDKSKSEKVADKFLEIEEYEKLIEAMSPTTAQLTRFLVLSGLRIGEALALSTNDISLDSRTIHVAKNRDPVTQEITTPKTFSSIRDVYMQDDLLTLCKEIRDYNETHPTIPNLDPEPFFWNELGAPMDYYGYGKTLGEVSMRVLGRKITPHVLRHTHASLLAGAGIDYEIISRRLGHENSKITRAIYIHVTEKRKELDAQALKEVHF